MENYKVYKHTTPNGKIYIGITRQSPSRRWRKGAGYKGNEYFLRAINKYGWEKIEHEILLEGLSREDAEQKETELIELYKSNDKKYGYNIHAGGNALEQHSKETKEKMRNVRKGKFKAEENYFYGKHHTEESRKK